jgi:hypothetical protein
MKIPNPPVNEEICRPKPVRLTPVNNVVAIQAPFPRPPALPVQVTPSTEPMGCLDAVEQPPPPPVPSRRQPVDVVVKEGFFEHKLISAYGMLLTRLELEQLECHLPLQTSFHHQHALPSSSALKITTLIKCIIRNFGTCRSCSSF